MFQNEAITKLIPTKIFFFMNQVTIFTTKNNHAKYFIFHQSYQGLILMKCGYIPHVFLLNMLILSIMYISEILFLPRIQGVDHYAVIKYVIFDKFVIFEMKYTTKPSFSHGYFCGFRYYNRWSVNITKQIHGIPKALEENGHRKCLKMIFLCSFEP